jgi:hypothetical protein
MPVVYTPFLRLQATGDPAARTVNVIAGTFEEVLVYTGGGRQRAADGTLLTTERTAKMSWRCTADFLTGADYESFLAFISTGIDAITGKPTGPRHVFLLPSAEGPGRRASGSAYTVMVYVTRAVEIEEVVPGASPANPVNRVGWRVDLEIEEV